MQKLISISDTLLETVLKSTTAEVFEITAHSSFFLNMKLKKMSNDNKFIACVSVYKLGFSFAGGSHHHVNTETKMGIL